MITFSNYQGNFQEDQIFQNQHKLHAASLCTSDWQAKRQFSQGKTIERGNVYPDHGYLTSIHCLGKSSIDPEPLIQEHVFHDPRAYRNLESQRTGMCKSTHWQANTWCTYLGFGELDLVNLHYDKQIHDVFGFLAKLLKVFFFFLLLVPETCSFFERHDC